MNHDNFTWSIAESTNKDSYQDDEQRDQMQILTLHRYYIHTTLMKKQFEAELAKGEHIVTEHDDPAKNVIMTGIKLRAMPVGTFMDYWYGGLFVVCEGWKELKLQDDAINQLLDDPKLDLLKRFRNAAFHYQKDYLNPKHQGLIDDRESVKYVRSLSQELGRWFLEHLRDRKTTPKEQTKG